MVYHGPREQVVPFFDSLGFSLPERKGVADFLQEVCSQKDQEVIPLQVHSAIALLPTHMFFQHPFFWYNEHVSDMLRATCLHICFLTNGT